MVEDLVDCYNLQTSLIPIHTIKQRPGFFKNIYFGLLGRLYFTVEWYRNWQWIKIIFFIILRHLFPCHIFILFLDFSLRYFVLTIKFWWNLIRLTQAAALPLFAYLLHSCLKQSTVIVANNLAVTTLTFIFLSFPFFFLFFSFSVSPSFDPLSFFKSISSYCLSLQNNQHSEEVFD